MNMTASIKSMVNPVSMISLVCLSHPCLANESLSQTTGVAHGLFPMAPSHRAVSLDLGWDSKYVSQGRNNLANGGIYWLNASVQHANLSTYALVGRGDNQAYTEWNIGLEYALDLSEHLDANFGYQRIESYGDSRCQDNELFAELAYTAAPWLVPSISYVYSTEAAGYFVGLSLHSYWQLTEQFIFSPYVTQGIDFKYNTQEHNGRNHLQFGLEASYNLAENISISGHISRSIAQADIKQEAAANGDLNSQNQTYAGIHLHMNF